MPRHADASSCFIWGLRRCLSSLVPIYGGNCPAAQALGLPPRLAGAWPPAHTRLRRRSIRFVRKNRDLLNLSAPRRRPKKSCDGLPQAKTRSRNSKLIVLATKQASRYPLSPPGWIRKAGANWKRLASSTADSGRSQLLRLADEANDAASRLGFIKHLDEPNPRISGRSCQGSDMPARRALKRPRRGL
jgi:hypothetical protein